MWPLARRSFSPVWHSHWLRFTERGVRKFLRHHFPTLASWDAPHWIMLFLTGCLLFCIVQGMAFNEKTVIYCTDCKSLDEVYAADPKNY